MTTDPLARTQRARTTWRLAAATLVVAGSLLAQQGGAWAAPVTHGQSPSGVMPMAGGCSARGLSSVTQAQIIARGAAWVNAHVPYSQTACHRDGGAGTDMYRTDCSGYVSMVWGLSTSYTTWNFIKDTSDWKTIAWSSLQPGDAIVASNSAVQHIVLFTGWVSSAQTAVHDYEEKGRAYGTVANTRSVSTLKQEGFHPIRYQHQAAQITEGTFVRNSANGSVYRIAGGSPVYVSSWTAFGGAKPVVNVTAAYLASLRATPADGTFIRGAGTAPVYRIAGGAPVYVSTWTVYGGAKPVIDIDPAAITKAGTGRWGNLRVTPADGTFIRDITGGQVYRVEGSAPIYVSTWTAFGGAQPYVDIDPVAITNAGGTGIWSHLAIVPVDGTHLTAAGTHYVVTAGHANTYTGTDAFPATTTIDPAAITNAGGASPWNHLK